MHTWMILAVEAESSDDATAAAEGFLDDLGPGTIYDWYVVGGRWSGLLDGANTLSAFDDPDRFVYWVNEARRAHLDSYNSYRRQITGEPVTPEEAESESMGLGGGDLASLAERLSELNAQRASALQRLLAEGEPPVDADEQMAAFILSKFARLANDRLCFDTFLWDTRRSTSAPDGLLAAAWDTEQAVDLWLVVVDLHN